jgi:hypothetical protein
MPVAHPRAAEDAVEFRGASAVLRRASENNWRLPACLTAAPSPDYRPPASAPVDIVGAAARHVKNAADRTPRTGSFGLKFERDRNAAPSGELDPVRTSARLAKQCNLRPLLFDADEEYVVGLGHMWPKGTRLIVPQTSTSCASSRPRSHLPTPMTNTACQRCEHDESALVWSSYRYNQTRK